jgi:hypothetical protein
MLMTPVDYKEPEQFVNELDSMRAETLQKVRSGQHGRLSFGDPRVPASERKEVAAILKLLMYPERRVADVLAKRIPLISDFDIKERMAAQIFEELTHTGLLRKMLSQWGHDGDAGWNQPLKELVHIFDYIETLETPAEFFSTFLIGEGLFLSTYLDDMQLKDPKAFSPYLEVALADEPGHIQLAKDALARYATTAELQARTRVSARRLLDMFLGGYVARIRQLHEELSATGDISVFADSEARKVS